MISISFWKQTEGRQFAFPIQQQKRGEQISVFINDTFIYSVPRSSGVFPPFIFIGYPDYSLSSRKICCFYFRAFVIFTAFFPIGSAANTNSVISQRIDVNILSTFRPTTQQFLQLLHKFYVSEIPPIGPAVSMAVPFFH